ncbi:MAG TPA: aldo/keto reductase [Noviherbaspirillum sp.]|jgi:aryl-alcohol dehydrogenase-like predicted oxidoreductase|uniref:aldo/keto reductase n=1 Tax=Noviherbaspirillum sp. TaxID=1926288 RepID=UPI002DDD782F|nr:aldo/keto reductase [Noviherbaspirillum sp.]HEV2610330.1 aldo/keto reductase [Noviherbaspirillum sp.]
MADFTLNKRKVGSHGVAVSELGFGAGGFWGMEIFSEQLARNLVDVAIDHGVNFFDTGPNYSGGNAEVRLGKILGGRSAKLCIGTKCGTHLIGGRHVKDYSHKALRRSLDGSLQKLLVDHVDVLQLHGMPKKLDDETIEFLIAAKRRGDARLLGVSTDLAGAELALSLGIFDCVMIEYNVIKRREQEHFIGRCADAGLGIMVKSPLAQTLYSDEIFKIRKLSDVWYLLRALKNHRSKFLAGRKYRFLSGFENFTCHELALEYVLSNPNISCAIIGTTNPSHLVRNFSASLKTIPEDIKRSIEAIH